MRKPFIYIGVFLASLAFLTGVVIVRAAFTYNVKRDLGSAGTTITDLTSPTFTATAEIGVLGTEGYLYLYPNDSPPTCNASSEGTIYADDSEAKLKFCNGSSWVTLEY